jgi:hypothetical protein
MIIVWVGAVKIHVAAVEALRKNEKYDNETQFITKIDGFFEFQPHWNARVLISGLKKHFETLAFSPQKKNFEKKKRKK